jgi:aryl-alcohol dehydrogenase-like predicted oxidoreductase
MSLSTAIQTRPLVHSGSDQHLPIAPIVFGGNVFGWTIDEPTSFAILDSFLDRGFNCIDTADVYSAWVPGHTGGESETILGKWLTRSGKRDQVTLLTKVGHKSMPGSHGLKKAYILSEVENSLRRLQTDYIDLYQSHMDDPDTPQDETLEAYAQLIQQGKVRHIGASNFTGARLTQALDLAEQKRLPRYATLQPEYNLYDRQAYEQDLAPVAARFHLGVIPYFSLASGFLTGKYQSLEDAKGAKRETRVQKYFDDRGMAILKALKQVSEESGASQAAISLAWLLAQPTITAPIASATSVHQMDSMSEAVQLHLTPTQLQTLTNASAY